MLFLSLKPSVSQIRPRRPQSSSLSGSHGVISRVSLYSQSFGLLFHFIVCVFFSLRFVSEDFRCRLVRRLRRPRRRRSSATTQSVRNWSLRGREKVGVSVTAILLSSVIDACEFIFFFFFFLVFLFGSFCGVLFAWKQRFWVHFSDFSNVCY